jgi:diguanylate cyclase (GGDEF)-like protein/PAS domain S-box-containing protein
MRGTIQDITDRKRAEADLRQSEELLQLFIQHAPAALAMFDRDMRYIAVSRRWLENYDLRGRNIIGHSHYDVFPDLPPNWLKVHRRGLGGETLKSDEERYDRADGGTYWIRWEVRPWLTGTGSIGGIIIFSEDITARKQAEAHLELAASVFTHAAEGIVITDPSGTILDVNDSFTQITGYGRDEVLGRKTSILRSGRQSKEFYANMWHDLAETGHWSGEIWNRAKDGRVFAEMLTITAVRDKAGSTRQYVALFSDITTEIEREQALRRVAQYDLLTGLPNRSLLRDRLHHSMAQADRRGNMLVVVCLDLDDFKSINDRLGHELGDEILTTIAQRMKSVMRSEDTLARLGGDEFIAVLLDFDNIDGCLPLVAKLLEAASRPVSIRDSSLRLSVSAGIASYPQAEDVDADQLVRQAGQALYQSKIAGKNCYHIYDPRLAVTQRGHQEDLERIRVALDQKEFLLYYQPKMNMATGAIVGAEALIRWRHPQRSLLSPGEFLPIVEGHALALQLGEWVIDSALTQMERWRAAGLDIPVSVNIAVEQLQHAEFVSRLSAALVAHPSINPGRFEIEVLESSALPDIAQLSQVIHTCGRLGVSFALDDFGTGYSSLAYLKRLPVDVLKIDQTFVRDMLDDPEDLTIVEGMLGLASAFHRQAIAEGVETVEQGIVLLRLGCQVAQGYCIARPMPPEELPGWVASWKPDPRWTKTAALDHSDRPLLYAGAEHSAWAGAIEAHLHGNRRVSPILEPNQCRLGVWLASGDVSSGLRRNLESIHQRLHACGAEILALKAENSIPDAFSHLPHLHSLRDGLVAKLHAMLESK